MRLNRVIHGNTLTSQSKEDLRLFASKWGLDIDTLENQQPWPAYELARNEFEGFDGCPSALHIIALGRYGNRFYQILNAALIARRIGCPEIRVDDGAALGDLPRVFRGIKFTCARNSAQYGVVLRGVFFSYRGFERLIEPLDPWLIADTIDHLVAPFYRHIPSSLGDEVLLLHFRAGDVFSGPVGQVPSHYVMPPASFYISAIDFSCEHLGVTEVHIVYEDRGNPALEVVEDYLRKNAIRFICHSGTLEEDSALMRAACHMAIPYGTFGEAIALLSEKLKNLFCFRQIESHEWLYKRSRSLTEAVLRDARNINAYIIDDVRGGYIPAFGWKGTESQRTQMREYPMNALRICKVV